MLYNLLIDFSEFLSDSHISQVFARIAFVFAFSFFLTLVGIKYFIKFIHKKNIYQPIRDDIGLDNHAAQKKKTPTMGGIFIVLGTFLATILFADLSNNYVLIALFVMLSFGAIGFVDDYLKVTKSNTKGFRGSIKLVIQFIIVGLVILSLQQTDQIYSQTNIVIPFLNSSFDLGIFYIFFATLVIVGAGNAVNLTDGLDGLVSVPAIISFICFVLIIYATTNPEVAQRFCVLNIQNTGQLIMFCVAFIGAILAFLKFNLKPAKIFMGDVGSLAIGGSLGVLAVILKQEVLFAIIGLLFVIEALSVILQVSSYKLRGKRIFLMAPIHHHFEKKGWSEVKVVRVFWLASLIFAIIGMSSFWVK